MPYVLSKLANTQVYTLYAKGLDNRNEIVASVTIKGGADVTRKDLTVPDGVLTTVTKDDLEILERNKDFQRHLEGGFVKIFNNEPNVEKQTETMTQDNSRQITKKDYKKKGKKAPKTESEDI